MKTWTHCPKFDVQTNAGRNWDIELAMKKQVGACIAWA
jgi:hypothetical protein